MATTPSDLIQLANESLKANSEVSYRNAASRAYYALFHEVTSRLTNLPDRKESGTHESLITYLKTCNSGEEPYDIKELENIGYKLGQSKLYRVEADYKLDDSFPQAKGQRAVDFAKKVMQQAQSSMKRAAC
ncbi:hypothetical protein CWE13_00300 [Aliidiomarina shirensis]|uniref:Uncharacterized protein n=1 Tax=Aliidiomarina shirensis TaxID=1048642 RepID=A0A432WWK6_9GAMM|nr:HEPN domain-containing protein [Aliidiomarina shirensis]RUO38129.1 hypothetical protein CWE13_00300 [Aliidiomarina shirensis]